jgi:hypothetical protein
LAALLAGAAAAVYWRTREPDLPRKYRVAGTVTYLGEPVASGDMYLEPQHMIINRWTAARAFINDGHYQAEVVGGPHRVNLLAPQFPHQLYFQVNFPDAENVADTEIATHDIELPPLSENPTANDAETPESDSETGETNTN